MDKTGTKMDKNIKTSTGAMVAKIGHFPNLVDTTGHIPRSFVAKIGHTVDSFFIEYSLSPVMGKKKHNKNKGVSEEEYARRRAKKNVFAG